ncbi:MAG TPA: glycosyltransferase [Planctomycetes bacterium]|nr:glycosyltransferase [Fuerstiella sp.]HIK91794.1 glycosyltransferase [Planctomycetota bacterium]
MTENTTNPSVTFCITELDIGGAEKAMVRIAIGLQDTGWRVRVISLRNTGAMADPLRAAGIPVTALGCGSFADIRALWRLSAELRRNPTDLVQCFLHQANIYGRLAIRCCGRRGEHGQRPLVVSGVRVADRRRWVILSDRWTRSYSDHYVAVSEHVAETHAALCGLQRDVVTSIPNGVDVPEELIDAPNPAPHMLLSVGRLTTQKAPFDLLEAFRLLPDDLRCQCRLNFVGDGPLASSLQHKIDRLRLNDGVQLVGHSHDVLQLMRESTVLVLPSRWEGMPNVVLEAMAHALPVVATQIDGTRELIDDGITGWLVPSADPAALAERITTVLGDPEGRSSVAQNAQIKVSQHFSWPTAINRYDQLLRTLLATTPDDRAAKTRI